MRPRPTDAYFIDRRHPARLGSFQNRWADSAAAIERKSLAINGRPPTPSEARTLAAGITNFLRSLGRARFRALVVDFDGTMVDTAERFGPVPMSVARPLIRLVRHGVWLAVASGRGRSLFEALRLAFPEDTWGHVLLGMHNGATIVPLSADRVDSIEELAGDEWQPMIEAIGPLRDVEIKARRAQVSFIPTSQSELNKLWSIIVREIAKKRLENLRVLTSGHSVDVLRPDTGKLNVIKFLRECDDSIGEDDILVIGDKGHWPGNDYEILSLPHGLSVDEVSADVLRCWNLAPSNRTNRRALEFYLEQLHLSDGATVAF